MAYILQQPVRPQSSGYVFFKDLFTREECAKIIELHKTLPVAEAKVGADSEGKADLEKRRSELYWISWNQDVNWVFERIAKSVFSANSTWWGYHLAAMAEPLQLTHYKSEDLGHYDWHEDHGDTGQFLHRKLSCVMPLSDEFEGGNFEFYHLGKPPEVSPGTLIIFPSYKLHRVMPVTKGERWSLVNWVNGPPFV